MTQLFVKHTTIKCVHYLETEFVYNLKMPALYIQITQKLLRIRPQEDVFYIINKEIPEFLPLDFKFMIRIPEYNSKLNERVMIYFRFQWHSDAEFGHLYLSAEEENGDRFHFFQMPVIDFNKIISIDLIADYLYTHVISTLTLEQIKDTIEFILKTREIEHYEHRLLL